MPDIDEKKEVVDDPKVDDPKVDATVAAVKEVASTFADELKAMREADAAKATAVAPPPSGPTQAELQTEYEGIKTKYNEPANSSVRLSRRLPARNRVRRTRTPLHIRPSTPQRGRNLSGNTRTSTRHTRRT